MAGQSRRFLDFGYKQKKFKLTVNGVTIFERVLEPFLINTTKKIVLCSLRADNITLWQPFCELSDRFPKRIMLIELEEMTRGQAETVYLALTKLEDMRDTNFTIFNVDTILDNLPSYLLSNVSDDNLPSCIVDVKKIPGNQWYFVRTLDQSDIAVEMKEKIRISEYASTGLYWFYSTKTYKDFYERISSTNEFKSSDKEVYVSQIIDKMIQDNCLVKISENQHDIHFVVTPDEFESFAKMKIGS